MSTTYPTSKQTIPNPTGTDLLDNINDLLDHDYQHGTVNDTIEALQDVVGTTGDTSTTSHSYKLSEVTNTDKAVSKTAEQTITNKTLGTGTKIAIGGDSTGDLYQRDSTGALVPIKATANGQTVTWNASLSKWEPASVSTVTLDEKNALVGTSGTPSSTNKFVTNDDTGTSGASKVLRLDGTGFINESVYTLKVIPTPSNNVKVASTTNKVIVGTFPMPNTVAKTITIKTDGTVKVSATIFSSVNIPYAFFKNNVLYGSSYSVNTPGFDETRSINMLVAYNDTVDIVYYGNGGNYGGLNATFKNFSISYDLVATSNPIITLE